MGFFPLAFAGLCILAWVTRPVDDRLCTADARRSKFHKEATRNERAVDVLAVRGEGRSAGF